MLATLDWLVVAMYLSAQIQGGCPGCHESVFVTTPGDR